MNDPAARRAPDVGDFYFIADSIPHIVWFVGPDGTTEYVNRQATEYSGLPAEAMVGRRWTALVHPDDMDRIRSDWVKAQQTETPFYAEARLRRADADYRWHAFRGLPVRDDGGRVVRWLGTATDIHARRLLEDELRAAQARAAETVTLLDTLQSAAAVGFAFVDRDLRILRVNETLATLRGLRPELHVGRTVPEVMPDLWPALEPIYRRVLATGEPVLDVELVGNWGPGVVEPQHRLASWYPVRVDDEIVGVGVIVIDITDRIRAERAQAHLAAVVQSSDDAILTKSLDGTILTWNPGATALYGYDESEVVGRNIAMLLPDDRPGEMVDILARIGRGERIQHFETVQVRKDGTRVPVALAVWPLKDADGRVVGASMLAHDVTERQRLQAELEAARDEAVQAARAKAQFLANTSHELRTPMTAIIGMSELLLGTDLDDEQREMAETVERAADDLLRTINDILDVSDVATRTLQLDVGDVDLARMVDEVGREVAARATGKGLRFVCQRDPDTPATIRGDAERIRQMLLNLATNAVKFTERGEVVIRVGLVEAREAPFVRFTVADTGVGIAAGDQWRLFRAFSQIDMSDTRRFGGNGLGLALVAELAEAMGGTVGVASSLGRGSTFWFEIPVRGPPSRP